MKDLESWLKERRITEVECLVTDITGIARGKITPVSKFVAEKGMRLPESVLLQSVTGDYVEDDIYYSLLDPADIDMVCKPDAGAAYPVPWALEPTAQVIHDCFDKMGNPIELSARNQLKKVLSLYAEQGWRPIVAPEMEFYLTKRCEDPDLPLQPPIGRSGRQETGRQSFSIDAANEFDPLFEDLYDWCEAQGPIHAAGTTIGNAICYEIIYADRVAEQARDAELLLTVSNDTWFGRSIGPLQHLQMARLRALENGRYLIRATSNGVTAIVDPQGRVTARAPQFQATSLRGEVMPMVGNTPFTRTGSWPTWLLAALLVLLGWRFNTHRSG